MEMSKSKLKFVSLAVSLALSIGVNADEAVNLVKNGDAEAGTIDGWSTWSKLTVVADGAKSGTKCFKVTGKQEVLGMAPIPVDPEKTYELSGWFKAAGDKPSTLYFGLMPLDKNMKRIEPHQVFVIAGSDTVLAEACQKSDTVIKIKDGAKWQVIKDCGVVAFDTDPAGGLADLPNANTSSFGITAVEKKDGYWEVSLAKPCGKDYPAGTAVREQRAGGSYIYSAAADKKIPTQWTQLAGSVKGTAKGHSNCQFWPGTAFVRIAVLANFNEPDVKLLIDDLQFKEASQPVK
jgi:hypothetical protein